MSLANHAGTAEYQLPASPSITEQPLSHLHTESSVYLLSADQPNALTCEGRRGTYYLSAPRYKAGNLWHRGKWIHNTEQAITLSEGVKQVAEGNKLLASTREELLDCNSQTSKSLICRNCLMLMPKIICHAAQSFWSTWKQSILHRTANSEGKEKLRQKQRQSPLDDVGNHPQSKSASFLKQNFKHWPHYLGISGTNRYS